MTLIPLQTRQVYVVVRKLAEWNEYPTRPSLVRDNTIQAIVKLENTSDNVLVYYNFSQASVIIPKRQIFIFDWDARTQYSNGLTLAYQ